MKYKIGIYGSAAGDVQSAAQQAAAVGQALARHASSVIAITGACSGLPYAAASIAAAGGVEVWGFSPEFDEAGQKLFTPRDDLSIYRQLIYTSRDFQHAGNDLIRKKYRNVLSTAACDAGIIISGRWGSLNEFTNLIDMRKTVGVLTSTGGIADELPALSQKIRKEGQGHIIFNDNPEGLVTELIAALQQVPA